MIRQFGHGSLWIRYCENVVAGRVYYEANKYSIDWDEFDRWIWLCYSNEQTLNMALVADDIRLGHEKEYLRALSYFITTLVNFKDWNGCAPLEFIMNYVLFLVLTTNTIKFIFNQRITELWPICRHRPICVTLPYSNIEYLAF